MHKAKDFQAIPCQQTSTTDHMWMNKYACVWDGSVQSGNADLGMTYAL